MAENTAWEPTEADTKAALTELLEQGDDHQVSLLDTWAVVLDKWDMYETGRTGAYEDFQLRRELHLDRNELAKRYAEAKYRVVAIETRLLTLLSEMTENERDTALTKSFVLSSPAYTKMVGCKKELADRLRKKLITLPPGGTEGSQQAN